MAQEECSKEGLRKLAAEVVRVILQEEALANELGDGLSFAARKTCPKNNKCTTPFRCPKPFSCPKVHSVEPPPVLE